MFDIGNSLINPSNAFITDSFGYSGGALLVIFLMNFHKRFIILSIILSTPIIAIICIGISRYDTDYKYFGIWLVNIAYGLIEVMNVRLILVNSNRPEFFVAMYYLLTTLGQMLMFISFKYEIYRVFCGEVYVYLAVLLVSASVSAWVLYSELDVSN